MNSSNQHAFTTKMHRNCHLACCSASLNLKVLISCKLESMYTGIIFPQVYIINLKLPSGTCRNQLQMTKPVGQFCVEMCLDLLLSSPIFNKCVSQPSGHLQTDEAIMRSLLPSCCFQFACTNATTYPNILVLAVHCAIAVPDWVLKTTGMF